MRSNNLFINTRSLTSSKEDHLTEFIAALITMDEPFRLAFSSLLLGQYAAQKEWSPPVISHVETQINYPGTNCCPDMRFTLEDGHIVLCENKIEALETQGSSADPRGQLLRYLDLPTDGVAYIRATPSNNLHKDVIDHPGFITHEGRHFLWRDIYPLLSGKSNPLVAAVCKGFEVMGFVPPHPSVGSLSDFNSKVNEQNRAEFKELWSYAAEYGLQRGWKVEANKNAELYYTPDAACPAYQVFVSPSKAERFLIRISLRDDVDPLSYKKKMDAATTDVPFETSCYERYSYTNKIKVNRNVIDITSSLTNVIGTTDNKALIQQSLLEYVKCFVALI